MTRAAGPGTVQQKGNRDSWVKCTTPAGGKLVYQPCSRLRAAWSPHTTLVGLVWSESSGGNSIVVLGGWLESVGLSQVVGTC